MIYIQKCLALVGICLLLPLATECWKDYEMDLFDLVEEVGMNFYELYGISKDSDSNEVRKAYRKLSLKWHPDKNSEPDAETMFRKVVAVYEVLKDEEKRKRYNEILEFGLPDWKQPIFYYRRVRKLNFWELFITLAVVISIGHYFVMWAQYFENKLALDERLTEARKRIEKKQKKKNKNFDMDEVDQKLLDLANMIPKPSIIKTLPVRFVMWLYANKLFIPMAIESLKGKKEKIEDEEIDEEELKAEENRKRYEEAEEKRRQRVKDLNPKKIEKSNMTAPVVSYKIDEQIFADEKSENSDSPVDSKPWSESEKAALTKAITKYPSGLPDRWNIIAKFVNRPVQECLQMEKELKASFYQISGSGAVKSSSQLVQNKRKDVAENKLKSVDMTVRDDADENDSSKNWTQEQQKHLEVALKQISKDAADRWEKISELVPGKTKDDCIQRCKFLCQSIKQGKSK